MFSDKSCFDLFFRQVPGIFRKSHVIVGFFEVLFFGLRKICLYLDEFLIESKERMRIDFTVAGLVLILKRSFTVIDFCSYRAVLVHGVDATAGIKLVRCGDSSLVQSSTTLQGGMFLVSEKRARVVAVLCDDLSEAEKREINDLRVCGVSLVFGKDKLKKWDASSVTVFANSDIYLVG